MIRSASERMLASSFAILALSSSICVLPASISRVLAPFVLSHHDENAANFVASSSFSATAFVTSSFISEMTFSMGVTAAVGAASKKNTVQMSDIFAVVAMNLSLSADIGLLYLAGFV